MKLTHWTLCTQVFVTTSRKGCKGASRKQRLFGWWSNSSHVEKPLPVSVEASGIPPAFSLLYPQPPPRPSPLALPSAHVIIWSRVKWLRIPVRSLRLALLQVFYFSIFGWWRNRPLGAAWLMLVVSSWTRQDSGQDRHHRLTVCFYASSLPRGSACRLCGFSQFVLGFFFFFRAALGGQLGFCCQEHPLGGSRLSCLL